MPLMERLKVPGDLHDEPRRVLHGARGRRARSDRRTDRRPRAWTACRRPRCSQGIAEQVRELDRRHSRASSPRSSAPSLPSTASGSSSCEQVQARAGESDRAPLPRADLPRADAARDRPRPPVPVYLEPVAQSDRPPPGPRPRSGGLRARQGAEGGPAPVRRDLAEHVHLARGASRATSTSCSPGWRSSATTCSGSRATPISRYPTKPTTCWRLSRTSFGAGGLARLCGSRSAQAWTRRCAPVADRVARGR